MAAHSTFHDINYMFNRCDNVAKRRFFSNVEDVPGCILPPTGIPNRFVAAAQFTNDGYVMDPSVKMRRISFNNVTVAGTKLSTLFTDPAYQGAVVTGGAKGSLDLTFDGVPYNPPAKDCRLSETSLFGIGCGSKARFTAPLRPEALTIECSSTGLLGASARPRGLRNANE